MTPRTLIAAVIVLTLDLAACTSWRVEPTVPARSPELRVTLTDGSRTVLLEVELDGDSLVGYERVAMSNRSRHSRRAFAAADVRLLEQRRFELVRTAALLVITTGVVAYVTVYFGTRGT